MEGRGYMDVRWIVDVLMHVVLQDDIVTCLIWLSCGTVSDLKSKRSQTAMMAQARLACSMLHIPQHVHVCDGFAELHRQSTLLGCKMPASVLIYDLSFVLLLHNIS